MRLWLYEGVGYYCWLVPSCLSCFLCCLVVIKNLLSKGTVLTRLQSLYAVGEVVQCLSVFPGTLYTLEENNSSLCPTQQILFQSALLMKTNLTLFVSGMFLVYTISQKNFSLNKCVVSFCLAMLIAVIFISLNLTFQSWRAVCHGIVDHSGGIGNDRLYYLLFFLIPIILNVCMVNIFSSVGVYYRQENLSSALLSSVFDSLVIFQLIVFIALLPCLIFIVFLYLGRMNIIIYCLTGILLSSTGTLFSLHQFLAPHIFKLKRFNTFFFLERVNESVSLSPSFSDGFSRSSSFASISPSVSAGFYNSPFPAPIDRSVHKSIKSGVEESVNPREKISETNNRL